MDLSGFDWDRAGRIAVQSGGRVKPLDSFARELVAQVCGRPRFRGQHPVETYFCWMADGEFWAREPLLRIPMSDLRTQLGLSERAGNFFSLAELRENSALMSLAMEAEARQQANQKLTFTQSKASELLNRLQALSAVFAHETPLFVPTADGDPAEPWQSMPVALQRLNDSTLASVDQPISDTLQVLGLAFGAMFHSLRDGRADIFNTSVSVFCEAQAQYLAMQPRVSSRLEWEYRLNRLRPFFWAKILLAVGFVGCLLSLRKSLDGLARTGGVTLGSGLALYTVGLALRAYVAGRAPWSNMYESLLAIGWALGVISLIYSAVRRERIFGLVGCGLGAVVLSVAQFASLDRGINPLVPALQSYWLNYHVIITLTGYACFAIAMGLGHAVLITGVRSKGEVTPSLASLSKSNLRIVQVGSLFLITGILLGAVWANVSWGRFWGWDPKETWALICWFYYIVLLHGRSAGWLGWRGLAAWSVGGFPVVIMTYYGVNYYLSGLHSYGAGSSPGIPWQVFAYFGGEAVFLFWSLISLKGRVPVRPKKRSSKTVAMSNAQPTEVIS